MRFARLLPLIGLAALAACAKTAGGPAISNAPPPEQIDGRYVGIQRLARAAAAGCPRSGRKIVTVSDSALSLQYRGPRASYALAATVSPDGSVHGSDGRGSIDGQISGRHMDLTVSSEFCDVRYALDRAR